MKVRIKGMVKSMFQLIKRLMISREGTIGLAIMVFYIILAVFAPYISPFNPYAQDFESLQPPSVSHLLGTDPLGRDVFSRIVYGARIALLFAFGVAGISMIVGILLGAFAGYFGGLLDDVLSRAFEVVFMLPSFFLIILAVAIYGASIINALLIVAFTMWPSNARITRAQVLTLKKRLYVDAATVTGAGTLRKIFCHILPNGILPVIVNSTFQMSAAVLMESALSFLGLGDPNAVSWGRILWDAQRNLTAWWLMAPGVTIATLCLGFALLADGISIAFSPRLQGEKA